MTARQSILLAVVLLAFAIAAVLVGAAGLPAARSPERPAALEERRR